MICLPDADSSCLAVVPVLVGPIQVLLALLPGLLVALGGVLLSLFKPAVVKAGLKLLWRLKYYVLAAAAAVVGMGYAARLVAAGRGPDVSGREAGEHAWPLFRGSLARLGAMPGQPGPTAGGINWSSASVEKSFLSSPAVAGNRVYATSAQVGLFAERGAIYCFDADTGGVVWTCAPKGYRPTFSSPAVSGKRLVVGEGLHFTRDARVMCLDIEDRPGTILWEYRTKSHVESSPAIAGGRAYIGAGDDGYYCFELEPETPGVAKVVWHVSGEQYPDAETCPAVHEGRVYVGLGMGGRAVCCLDAATGKEIWRVPTPYPVFAPPTIARGKVFVGMGNGNFVQSAEEVRAAELKKLRDKGAGEAEIAEASKRLGPAGEVWRLDAVTGKVEWRFDAGRVVLAAVVAGPDKLYLGTGDGTVFAVSYEGRQLARWCAHAGIYASPALTESYLYTVSGAGRLYALHRDTLQPEWEFSLGREGMFFSSPAVARGHVYVGTQSDGLLCVGVPAQAKAEALWPGALGGPGAGGAPEQPPVPERAAFIWNYPEGQDENAKDPLVVSAPVACAAGKLYVPVASGARLGLACLPGDARAMTAPKETSFFRTAARLELSPAVVGQKVLFVEGARGQPDRRLFCLDAASGESWVCLVSSEASGEFLAAPDGVYIQAQPGELTRLDLDGSVPWTQKVGPLVGTAAVQGPLLVAAIETPPALAALDRATGAELWRAALSAAPRTGPALMSDRAYVGTEKGVEARSLLDGALVPGWEPRGGPVTGGNFALSSRFLAFVNVQGELVRVATESGELLDKHPGALAGLPPVLSRGVILYVGNQGLMRFAPGATNAAPVQWLDTSWLGAPTSPPVLTDSGLYLGMGKWGLIRVDQQR